MTDQEMANAVDDILGDHCRVIVVEHGPITYSDGQRLAWITTKHNRFSVAVLGELKEFSGRCPGCRKHIEWKKSDAE